MSVTEPTWFRQYVCLYLNNVNVTCPSDDVDISRYYFELDVPSSVRENLISQIPNRTETVLPSSLLYIRQDNLLNQQTAWVVLFTVSTVIPYCNRLEKYMNAFYFPLTFPDGVILPILPFQCEAVVFQNEWVVSSSYSIVDKPLIVSGVVVGLLRLQQDDTSVAPRAVWFSHQSDPLRIWSTGMTLDNVNFPTNLYRVLGVSSSVQRWAHSIVR